MILALRRKLIFASGKKLIFALRKRYYLRTILDAADRSSAGARAREGRIGRCNGRLAEACSARERPGRGGRWCGLNDRTLMCEVVLCVGHKATKPPNNIRYLSTSSTGFSDRVDTFEQ